MTEGAGSIIAIVPARNSAAVGTTVSELLATGRVDRVVVVDDGSTDDTAERAHRAGATVVSLSTNWGKGDAVAHGVAAFADASVYLLVDADLAETAGRTVALLDPVARRSGRSHHRRLPRGRRPRRVRRREERNPPSNRRTLRLPGRRAAVGTAGRPR